MKRTIHAPRPAGYLSFIVSWFVMRVAKEREDERVLMVVSTDLFTINDEAYETASAHCVRVLVDEGGKEGEGGRTIVSALYAHGNNKGAF